MTEDDRLRELRSLQAKMQVTWDIIEAAEKAGQRTNNLWVQFEIMEVREFKLLRVGSMVA